MNKFTKLSLALLLAAGTMTNVYAADGSKLDLTGKSAKKGSALSLTPKTSGSTLSLGGSKTSGGLTLGKPSGGLTLGKPSGGLSLGKPSGGLSLGGGSKTSGGLSLGLGAGKVDAKELTDAKEATRLLQVAHDAIADELRILKADTTKTDEIAQLKVDVAAEQKALRKAKKSLLAETTRADDEKALKEQSEQNYLDLAVHLEKLMDIAEIKDVMVAVAKAYDPAGDESFTGDVRYKPAYEAFVAVQHAIASAMPVDPSIQMNTITAQLKNVATDFASNGVNVGNKDVVAQQVLDHITVVEQYAIDTGVDMSADVTALKKIHQDVLLIS
ncbi:MAG: hypothetical protein K2X98_04905 [Alphaproteobacteria bacterium]|nr:hypothetical protein [Alphaproteobacteria bacterium]